MSGAHQKKKRILLEYQPARAAPDEEPITLALLQPFLANQGDAWHYTLDYLNRFFEGRGGAGEMPAPDAHGGYLALIDTLATRTAELHLALATPSEDAAFNPEPIGPADLAAWMTRIRTEAEASFELLARSLAALPHSHRILAEQLLGRRAELLERLARPPDTRWQGLKTRYHGDYHLGQVLVRRNDFVIIDFEGEPGRTPAERRAKHSPLRDVAGLLRSFNYARFTALKDRSTEQPRDYETLEPLARAWESQTRAAFLEAYARAVSGSPLYVDFDRMAELLELFELEKAFYELRYELNNRPDWSDIPLHGLLAVGASTPGL